MIAKPLALLLAALTTAALATAPAEATGPAGAAAPALCTGEFRGDARLGPRHLPGPRQEPVGPLLKGWKRTGGLGEHAFLKKYWEGDAAGGSWKYPPNDGFTETNGAPDRTATRLRRGERLDRFGSVYGAFLAPAEDAYAKRALPPQNLGTREADAPCGYHVYEVTKRFTVWQGRIAPWFGQPGGGHQIKLDPALLDPGEGEGLNVKWLLDHDYLRALVG
ncbi:TNT domain-containing protein [Streptomyces sp. NPDC004959]|uniref:TNT domain-containing protein n=1 Tax=Streptomyces sp. NPDC004959 TaxID=3154673 RepID=UPI0033A6E8F1